MKRIIVFLFVCVFPLALFLWQVERSPMQIKETYDIEYLPEKYKVVDENYYNDEAENVSIRQFRKIVSKNSEVSLKISIDPNSGGSIKYFGKDASQNAVAAIADISQERKPYLVSYEAISEKTIPSNIDCEKGAMEVVFKKSMINYGFMAFMTIYWILLFGAIKIGGQK